ncbi:hypothetical protein AB0N29_01815 [Nocardioides sp. NPDC092400]|uniref:hypothetical protein n=1 Tax=Nocardioides sp. NPDC092400 TaxID=3155196 RepID=UPI003419A353
MSVVTPAAAATKTQKDAAGDVDVFEPAPVNEKSDIRSVTVTATKKTIKVIVKVKDLVPDSDSEN